MTAQPSLMVSDLSTEGIIELPAREAMTGLGLSICVQVEVSVGFHGSCYDPCKR
jgi:hypothetical protein